MCSLRSLTVHFICLPLLAIFPSSLRADQGASENPDNDPLPAGALLRIGTTRFRPGAEVSALVFSSDGKQLVSANGTTGVQCWDAASGQLLRRYGRPDWVRSTAMSADGTVAAIMENKTCIILDTHTGKTRSTIAPPKDCFYNLALSPDGTLLAEVGGNGSMRVWDLATGKISAERKATDGIRFESLVWAAGNRILALMPFVGAIEIWDIVDGKMLWKTPPVPSKRGYMGGAFSPDGKTFASTPEYHESIHLFDVEKGTLRLALQNAAGEFAFTPDGKALVTTDRFREITLWDVVTGLKGRSFAIAGIGLQHLAVSPDGQWLAAAESQDATRIRMWNLASGKERKPDNSTPGGFSDAHFLSNGKSFVTMLKGRWHRDQPGAPGCIQFWDSGTGKLLQNIPWPADLDYFASLSADGKSLAVAEQHGKLRLYDVASGKTHVQFALTTLRNPCFMAVTLSPDGSLLAVNVADFIEPGIGTQPKHSTLVFDTVTGDLLHTSPLCDKVLDTANASGAGATIALFSEMPKNKNTFTVKDLRSGARLYRPAIPTTQSASWSRHVESSRCGRFIAVRDWPFGSPELYEAATGLPLHHLPRDDTFAWSCAFSPNGRLLGEGTRCGDLRIWDVGTGKQIARVTGHGGPVTNLDFSPDGSRLVSASNDTTVLVWDTAPWFSEARRHAPQIPPQDVWQVLQSGDAGQACAAMAALAAAPETATKLLAQHLRPATAEGLKTIRASIASLDNPRYQIRQEATAALKQQSLNAVAELEQTLAGTPALEVRMRIEALLREMPDVPPPPDVRGHIRALTVLEWIGTAAAVDLLTTLSKGEPQTWLTREARASLRRMKN